MNLGSLNYIGKECCLIEAEFSHLPNEETNTLRISIKIQLCNKTTALTWGLAHSGALGLLVANLPINSDGAMVYITWCGAQWAIPTATLPHTESARYSFIFTPLQNPEHGPLKGTFLLLWCGWKMFNSLDLSLPSWLSPKFFVLIKVTILVLRQL